MTDLNTWLSIDKISGEGDADITLTASSSQETEEKIAALEIKSQTLTRTVVIKQKPNNDYKYFWVEFEDVGGAIQFPTKDYPYLGININFEYSFDGEVWVNNGLSTIEMGDHKKVYLYNKSQYLYVEGEVWFGIQIRFLNKNCRIGGNAAALSKMQDYAFHRLFYNNSLLTDASELCFPWESLSEGCFRSMFSYCVNLQYAPSLPSTTLSAYCYEDMFSECTSLTKAPILPSEVLMPFCYSLMFAGCTNLSYIEMYALDVNVDNCLNGWVGEFSLTELGNQGGTYEDGFGVAPTGTFKKSYLSVIPLDSVDGIPLGWTVEDDATTYAIKYKTTDGSLISVNGEDFDNTIIDHRQDVNGYNYICFSDPITIIKSYAFYEGKNEITELILPPTITTVEDRGFYGCAALEVNEIMRQLPNVDTYNTYVFYMLKASDGIVDIPNNVKTIGNYVFSSLGGNVTKYIIGEGVETIGDGLLSGYRVNTIIAKPTIAPSITDRTFINADRNGVLYHQEGSDYSSWMSTDQYYLGYTDWTTDIITE